MNAPEGPDWRQFFRLAVATAAIVAGVIYAFVVLVDPFDTLPLSPPLERWPVANNARYAFPALARSQRFDSAVFGTSTSRLLRPAVLDPAFGARFANLAMNDDTAWEQSQLFHVFARAHPAARVVAFGLDVVWCETGPEDTKLTPRSFPAWMYDGSLWRGYAEMFNMYAVQEAGQEFGVLTGIKAPPQGRDGFTSFVPPDDQYDPARAEAHIRADSEAAPLGPREGPPGSWQFPALERLRRDLASLPGETRKVLFFVPYNQVKLPLPGSPSELAWRECKRRVVDLAAQAPNALVVDFMIESPISRDDANYWDAIHYRIGIGDRVARDLAAAERGKQGEDYHILYP